MEEFSVEPPQDDPCTEDESDLMYFTPAGCLDSEDPLQNWHDSLEDVYLSAYDDLSPLSEESHDYHELHEGKSIEHGENEQTKNPTENEGMEDSTSNGPPATITDEEEEALHYSQKPLSQPDTVDASNNIQRDETQCGPCDESDRATSQDICSREDTHCCTENNVMACVHEDNAGKETVEDSNFGDFTPGDNSEDKDSVEDKGHVEISVPLNLQDGAISCRDNMVELEAMVLNLCPLDLPVHKYYDPDIPLVDELNNEDFGSPDQQESDLYSQEEPLMNQSTVMNLDLSEVRDPPYAEGVPLVHELTLKNLDFPKHYDKDDILLEKNMEPHSKTVQVFLQCTEDINAVGDNMTPKANENKEESPFCPLDPPIYVNPHLTADNTINMTECISLPEILSLLNCLETTEDQPQENTAYPSGKYTSNTVNQLEDTECSQCYVCSPHEMIQSDGLYDIVTMSTQADNQGPSTHHDRSSESKLQNSQSCSSIEQKNTDSTTSQASLETPEASRINPDGSVTMRLASIPNKVQQVKSVPVVPPKPQFAKLPLALKSIFHPTFILPTTRDIPKSPKPDKTIGLEPTEAGIDCAPKRRSSWRNATSVSFDTAMALAKERQQSQNPVRSMQTFCIGDSYEVIDSKMENSSNFPKFTIKPASSRTHRPLSCMSLSSGEAECRGNSFLHEDPNPLSLTGAQPLFQQEAEVYTKELPQRNRLSMPRIGRQSADDVHIHTSCHQRRSLL